MRQILYCLLLALPISSFAADELASCNGKLTGYSYYPAVRPGSSSSGAFEQDGIRNSMVTVRRTGDKIDVLYTDSTKTIKSVEQEGGKVIPLRSGQHDFTLLVEYPGESTDIYTFSDEGTKKTITLATSRSGDIVANPKSSLLVGECQLINIP